MRRNSKTHLEEKLRQDINYVDPELPLPGLDLALGHWVASAVIYGTILLLYKISPWFSEELNVPLGRSGYTAWTLYREVYVSYLVIGGLIFIVVRPRSLWASKNLRIIGYVWQLGRWCFKPSTRNSRDSWKPTYEQKQAIMFLLVKAFYGPLMVSSAVFSYREVLPLVSQFRMQKTTKGYLDTGYLLFVSGIFLVDVLLFIVGYHTESGLLKNKLRFVETNPLHILVCVACYPPFNMVTVVFFGPSYRNPGILFHDDITHPITWIMRGLAVFFLLLLIASSLSLFTKASNLTNRGIVTYGPYRFIRHPGYVAKNLFWIVTLIPFMINATNHPQFTWPSYLMFCATTIAGIIGWGTMYFLRAITEERFLMRDPEYVEYCKKVKYRFIPGIY